MSLDDIPIQIAPSQEGPSEMPKALLHEVWDLLQAVCAGRSVRERIDLHGLPLSPADYQQLQQLLGRGEVSALIEASGRSEVFETAVAGVWWLRDFGADERLVAEYLEITALPLMLMTHHDDLCAAVALLQQQLSAE